MNSNTSITPNIIPINNLNNNNAISQNSLLFLSPQNCFLINNNQTIPRLATIQPLNNSFNNTNNFNNNFNHSNNNNFNS